ncbi:MAG: NADH-quinone oxidoreductase subunit J [Candidatus Zixiibacteriota bacterium]|nr:MAG: NADH-quinone oxidoreductase subunit J [candidate division Zixibacteria bacterium]
MDLLHLLNQGLFWFFVVMTVVSAIVVVFSQRVIYSAFALLFTFFGVAALYLFLAADFLAASQVLIYVGGILTLIIFGVFLTAKIYTMDIPQQTHQRYLALLPVVAMLGLLTYGLFTADWKTVTPAAEPTTKDLGQLLLTTYLVPFEVASVLLLAALIGAVRLARPMQEEDRD